MAMYIEKLSIDHFRGINGLILEDLNHVNIIAGDNNCGKTSVLEALQLLRNPSDFNNVLRIARNRDMYTLRHAIPDYENFINLFPRDNYLKEITVNGTCMGVPILFKLIGEQKTILLTPEDLFHSQHMLTRAVRIIKQYPEGLETDAFIGVMHYSVGEKQGTESIEYHMYSRASLSERKNNHLNVVYLSSCDHLRGSIFNSILRDDVYKEICLNVLRLFDADIVDLLYLARDDSSRPDKYIKHAVLGNMPISTYGDGIKKVLSLANGIAQAANGILMIDEFETAIHSKYYDDIFRFLVKACKQFQVQLFVTTHSMEAIDGLLATQDYDMHNTDNISVLTFKKDNKQTFSRTLPGRRVYSNRDEFGFEVRL